MPNEPDVSLKKRLTQLRELAIADYKENAIPQRLLKTLCKNVDDVLTEAWKKLNLPPELVLIAVGGYGRGELFPYSDVDVLILMEKIPDAKLQEKLEALIQLFWTLGLTVGHSVRTIDECLEESANDITVQTSLLEARYVTGNRKLFQLMRERFNAQMNPSAFFIAKTLETRQRHVKFGDTPYSLEPNCKESPGGLRDLQVILWTAKAAKLGHSWNQLARRGLLTPSEAQQLKKTEEAFKDIRIRLHIHTQRCEDKLLFDVQIPVAKTFDFQENGQSLDPRRASEHMMQQYYRAAHTVVQLNMILLQNMRAWLFPKPYQANKINERFNDINGLIDIVDDDVFANYPSALLEVFVLLSERTDLKNMTARTLRNLWHARIHIDEKFRNNPVNRRYFLQIIQSSRFVGRALQHMNELGILGRYLPNFGKIIGQMQHDLFHQYTVDQHILNVVSNLHRFSLTEYAHENPLCSQLMMGFSKPWLLYIAALFHDIAKGRGGDHSILGMEDAKEFCIRHELLEEESELIVFLVKEHLTLSQVAQKKDLSDPETIRHFADIVKDERHLTALFLLTVADIRGTNPQIWNAWKSKLMEDLFHLTLRVLGGEDISVDHELKIRQKEAQATLRLYGLPEHSEDDFWKQLDIVYFLRHDASDIAWQTRTLYYRINSEEPVVKCRLSPIGEGLQVTVYLLDRPDLFALICSYFARKNFSILDAKIHTTNHDYALDTFLVTKQGFEKNYRDIITLVEHELMELLKTTAPLPPPLPSRLSRKSRSFPIVPTLDLRPDANGKNFVLSITANDRNGLLYAIALVFSRYKVNLHTAKIMTLGERIEDVFLIDSDMLQHPRAQIQFETDMIDVLRVN